jgi:hypothetical protein
MYEFFLVIGSRSENYSGQGLDLRDGWLPYDVNSVFYWNKFEG